MTERFQIPEDSLREEANAAGIKRFDVGAGVVRDSKLLLVRRIPDDFLGGFYELPGGGVEDEEAFEKALIREIDEETGLKVKSIIGMINGFDYPNSKKEMVRQHNFLVEVEEGDIQLAPGEHDEFTWIDEESIESIDLSPEMKMVVNSFFILAASKDAN